METYYLIEIKLDNTGDIHNDLADLYYEQNKYELAEILSNSC